MKILILKKMFIGGIIITSMLLLVQVEYDNFKLSRLVYPLIFITIPFILKYILLNERPVSRVALIIGILVYTAIILFYFLCSFICGWSKDLALYKRKNDKSLVIVCRTYDCYGTAEDCRLYQVRKLTNHINWVTKFKEKIVDTTKWENIPFNPEMYNP